MKSVQARSHAGQSFALCRESHKVSLPGISNISRSPSPTCRRGGHIFLEFRL